MKRLLKKSYKETFVPGVHPRLAVLALALIAVTFAVFAQAPPGGQPIPPMAKPSNLKVLPKDITVSDVMTLMKQYNVLLVVGCGYCHVEDPATRRVNFVSDAKPQKGDGAHHDDYDL